MIPVAVVQGGDQRLLTRGTYIVRKAPEDGERQIPRRLYYVLWLELHVGSNRLWVEDCGGVPNADGSYPQTFLLADAVLKHFEVAKESAGGF